MARQQSQPKPEVVVLNWKTASNSVLNGKGNWFNGGRLTQLVIQSKFTNGQWKRPLNFTFKSWKIKGSIRVLGVGSSASNAVKQSSFSLGHTRRMQAAAPTGITFSGLKIQAQEKFPLIAPAVRKVVARAFDHPGAQGDDQCGVTARLSKLTSGSG